MAVGAFKTKYTGQQMEELFDKLNDMEEVGNTPDGILTTSYPYTRTKNKYETDNIIITSIPNASNTGTIEDVIFNDTLSGIECNQAKEYSIIHEFKNNIKIKLKAIHILEYCYYANDNPSVKIYYVDEETQNEILLHTETWKVKTASSNYNIDVNIDDNIITSKLIVKVILRGITCHIAYDFEIVSTDDYKTNSLENITMQNNFKEA